MFPEDQIPQQINPVDYSKMHAHWKSEQERAQDMAAARQAYYGDFLYANRGNKPVTVKVGDIDDTVQVNRVKPIVNASVNLLFGTPPEFEIADKADGEGGPGRSEMEKWLDDCLRANNWRAKLLNLGLNGAYAGTPYLRIDLSNNIPNPGDLRRPFPRLQTPDPEGTTIKCSPRDIDDTVGYTWTYNDYDQQKKQPYVVRQRIERQQDGPNKGRWVITEEVSYTSTLSWQQVGAPVVWPFEWAPIDHCQNLPCPNSVYGDADVTHTVIDLNKARNFNLSNWSRIVRKHAQPKPYFTGMEGEQVDLDSEILDLPSPNAKVGQLTPVVDGAGSETLGKTIDEAICEETQTPSLVLGRPDEQGIPSGVALLIKLWPAIYKTETKRALYGPLLERTLSRLLEAGGWGRNIRVTLKWPEIIPGDPKVERDILLMDLNDLGVASPQTVSQKLGYDYEQEQKNIQEVQAANDERNAKLQQQALERRAAVMGPGQPVVAQEGDNNANGAANGAAPPPTR
jgi:hypothetical protein